VAWVGRVVTFINVTFKNIVVWKRKMRKLLREFITATIVAIPFIATRSFAPSAVRSSIVTISRSNIYRFLSLNG
jgi:hypothetical protein